MLTLPIPQFVATTGAYPIFGEGGPPIFTAGMLQSYAGTMPAFGAPRAQGQLLPTGEYQILYSLYGTLYGGDGIQRFALPNLEGRTIVGGRQVGQGDAARLTMTYMIAAESGGMAPFVGAVAVYGGNRVPDGWLPADGSLRSIASLPELFQAIGTTFGGDGATSFALPNLQGTAAVGTGAGVKLGQPVAGTVPGLGLNYAICTTNGVYPHPSGGGDFPENEPYLGQVLACATPQLPKGWAMCDGTQLPTLQYQALFSLLGYAYGGAGSAFALPDLQGRMMVGGLPGASGEPKLEVPMPAA